MTQILVLAGAKQSGKSSLANFLYGFYLTKNKVLEKFTIDDDGSLIVPATVVNEEGVETQGDGILELQGINNHELAEWASYNVWPLIKDYAFADSLKIACMHLFDLSYNQCYGTNDEKNSESRLEWDDALSLLPTQAKNQYKKEGKTKRKMTAREVLQFFGTEVCRSMYDNIWIDRVYDNIQREQPKLAIITDCRFKNEVLMSKEKGAKIIKLTKKIYQDTHSSETDLDDLPPETFDFVLDNENMTIKQKNMAMYHQLNAWNLINI